jgi:hypothetical protein
MEDLSSSRSEASVWPVCADDDLRSSSRDVEVDVGAAMIGTLVLLVSCIVPLVVVGLPARDVELVATDADGNVGDVIFDPRLCKSDEEAVLASVHLLSSFSTGCRSLKVTAVLTEVLRGELLVFDASADPATMFSDSNNLPISVEDREVDAAASAEVP